MSIQVQSNCYLHYAFQEASNGLRCSMDQTNTQTESIELGISNTRGVNVYVRKITLTFPLGSDQANHLAGSSNITFNYSPNDQFTVVQQTPGVFVITPIQSGTTVTWLNQGLYLRFTGIVMNTTLGVCKIKVDEISSLNTPNSTSDQVGWYWFGKYPYEFYMRNFVADNSTVAPNSSVTLSWTGAANGNYKMKWYDANGIQSADVTATRSWQSPPLLQSTVFELYGVSTSGPQRAISLAATVLVAEASASPAITNFLAGQTLKISGGQVELNCTGATTSAYLNRTGTLMQIQPVGGSITEFFHSATTGTVAWIDVYFVSTTGSTTISLTDASNSQGVVPLANTSIVAVANSWNRIVFSKAVSLKKGTKYYVKFYPTDGGTTLALGGSNHHINDAYCKDQPNHVNVWMDVAMTPLVPSGLVVTPEGKVGVGTMEPAYLVDVNGTVHATNVHESSDISLKRNITTLPDVMSQLLQLRGVQYERRDSGMREIGLISQEVEGVFPELVQQDAQGLGSVAYTRLTAVLVEAVKSLNAEVEALRAEIKDLRKG